MIFDGAPDRLWKPEETRNNEMVVIGRDLDRMKLKETFQVCLV